MEVDGGRHLPPPLLLDASTSGDWRGLSRSLQLFPLQRLRFPSSATSIKHFAKTGKENNGMTHEEQEQEAGVQGQDRVGRQVLRVEGAL